MSETPPPTNVTQTTKRIIKPPRSPERAENLSLLLSSPESSPRRPIPISNKPSSSLKSSQTVELQDSPANQKSSEKDEEDSVLDDSENMKKVEKKAAQMIQALEKYKLVSHFFFGKHQIFFQNSRKTQPTNLKHQLTDYQLEGLEWLLLLRREKVNGILADESNFFLPNIFLPIDVFFLKKWDLEKPFKLLH